ncbi:MAG TPA: hypothetical protein PKD64_05930 [Pirellulaceae bacterium]|nr:hypothetical protein [Pirellulaceae bacterium]HMO91718.1 hypothetical protein [Pirellulaceae bacterium]HMP69819.1 hypothetical protein [Pirellulaceae bacterium]
MLTDRFNKYGLLVALLSLELMLLNDAKLEAQISYQVVDIGSTISGATTSAGVALNAAGTVAVTFNAAHQWSLLAIWSDGVTTNVMLDGNRSITGIDANNSLIGLFAGRSWGWLMRNNVDIVVPEPIWRTPPFFYADSRTLAINESGVFTGALSLLAPPGSHIPFLSTSEAYVANTNSEGQVVVTRLGLLQGQSTLGWAINESGHVAGTAGPYNASTPFVYRNNGYEVLPTLGGPLNRPEGLNDTGFAVGFVSASSQTGGFYAGSGAVWDVRVPGQPNLFAIGQLLDSNQTWLVDINDNGIAVGRATKFQNSIVVWSRPIVWTANSGIVDLNELIDPAHGWIITEVRGINANGQIVGTGRFQDSTPRAVRLDPVATPKQIKTGPRNRNRR